MEFREGQIVKLNSGGMTMTVETVGIPPESEGRPVESAYCRWFDQKKVLQGQWFPVYMLRPDEGYSF